jgi:hypothetical protein
MTFDGWPSLSALGAGVVAPESRMSPSESIPMVRCHLDGGDENPGVALRYIPAAEFELWRHLMETRHGRTVTVEEVSIWIPDDGEDTLEHLDVEALEPVLRIEFEKRGDAGVAVPVRRFFPAETYPEAQAALLAHFDPRHRWSITATPGYFVPAALRPGLDAPPVAVS